MRHRLAVLSGILFCAPPAAAFDLPQRKPGLWELTMQFEARHLPPQVMRQCTDAATDKLLSANFAGSAQEACSKQDMHKEGGKIVVDSVCKFGEATTTAHAEVSGSFDSAYTVDVISTREGGHRLLPDVPAGGKTHMIIAAKWLGPCAAGQRPGDIIMGNGMTMNVLDMRKTSTPQGR
jgi:hypothetical protein